MRRVLLLALVLVAAAVAGLTWAVKNLPWWGTVAAVVGLIVLGRFVVGRLAVWAITIPFKWKGAVLKGATAEVHSVTASGPPPPTPGDTPHGEAVLADEANSRREQFQLDVTVNPSPAPGGKFTNWSPSELVLVKPESELLIHGRDDDDDSCEVKRVEVHQEGQFQEDDGASYHGSQRVRLWLGVRPGVSRLKFRYYFEEFGEVALPPAGATGTNPGWAQENAA
jgi:hypothetical protein